MESNNHDNDKADSTIVIHKEDLNFADFKERLLCEARIFRKVNEKLASIESELDHSSERYASEDASRRRRKSLGYKSFDFIGVAYKEALDDLNQVYGENQLEDFSRNFRKNDAVTCIVDKKKYKGTVLQVNQKGMTIKIKDKRKLRISWKDIDNEEVKVLKGNGLE